MKKIKERSPKEILENAKRRLKEMEFDLAFYKKVYEQLPTERIANKIELLELDLEEFKKELEVFMEGVK